MKAQEHLRKPKNWQDFEELCLKLWGAIWNKPEEIEYNSTNEQGQDGVDIYCWVDSEDGYVGIQCKGKKEEKIDGTENRITLSEIIKEIEKAERFEPSLKRYIIATTSEKDGEIQKEVRKIDAQRRSEGKFPVEIKFWDYISKKVDEHKVVHDWYVKSQNFRQNKSIRFCFKDGLREITLIPIFQKVTTRYYLRRSSGLKGIYSTLISDYYSGTKINKAFVPIQFKIQNIGATLENWKVRVKIDGDVKEISSTDEVEDSYTLTKFLNIKHDFIIKDKTEVVLIPHQSILVGGDEYIFEELYFKPRNHQSVTLNLHWELLSHDYQANGVLQLNLHPKVEIINKEIGTDDTVEARRAPEFGEIEDYICPKQE